jgi:hypothetical protein
MATCGRLVRSRIAVIRHPRLLLGDVDGVVIAMILGRCPTLIGGSAVLVAVRMGVTVPPSLTTLERMVAGRPSRAAR